ncbi:MAG: CBS domain-containing protein [Thermoprotei archaeon]
MVIYLFIRNIYTQTVITIDPDETLDKASEKMFFYGISRLVVVKNDTPIGIVTEKDITRYLTNITKPINQIKVSEVMSHPLITASPNDTVQSAARKMLEHNISSLVIVEDSKLKGIVTKFDIVKFCSTMKGRWLVRDYMTKHVISVSSFDTVFRVIDLMVNNNISRIVVADANNKPIGIITLADIVRSLPEISFTKLKSMRISKILRPLLLKSIMVSTIMSRDLIVIRENADLAEAAQAMVTYNISGLPVVNSEDKLVGIITKTDITRAISKLE